MKILVSFKSVPDANDVAVAGAAVVTPKSVINPFDEIAIEEALRIRERGEATEIVGVTIGVPAVDEQIRAALEMGVDRAIRSAARICSSTAGTPIVTPTISVASPRSRIRNASSIAISSNGLITDLGVATT